jgi:hypothetical protein
MNAPVFHTLAEVCEQTRLGKFLSDPEQWLSRQLQAGRFTARKIGRQWAMTDADIADMLDRLANPAAHQQTEQQTADGGASVAVLSPGSMRTRRRLA